MENNQRDRTSDSAALLNNSAQAALIGCLMVAFTWSAVTNLNLSKFYWWVMTNPAEIKAAQISPNQQSIPAAVGHVIVDINSANVLEFDLLPGIGPTIAARIVDDRNTRGRFLSVDSMSRVTGVGPRTVKSISKYCVVGDAGNETLAVNDRSSAARRR